MNAVSSQIKGSEKHNEMICIGVVFGAAGVRGAVRLKVFTEDIRSISKYGPVTIFGPDFPDGKKFEINVLHNVKGGVAAKLEGVDDRDIAESLKGAELYIERSRLPEIAEEEGFYFEDLIGLQARDQNENVFGTVDGVFNFGAGDIVEVDLKSEKGKRMYPFSDQVVPEVNIQAGYIVVDRAAFDDGTETEQKG